MTATSVISDCVAAYASRLHAAIGVRHHVASPLGAWLLLALAGPASKGADRVSLTEVLGCDVDIAAGAAAELLASPHPLVASAAAVWTARQAPLSEDFLHWRENLPLEVTSGDLPGQAGLDSWAREHTFGLIDAFPLRWTPGLYLVLASALATKVSWEVPFELAPATRLGERSAWAAGLSRVLHTPDREDQRGHRQFVAVTRAAGEVAVHMATAAGGLLVVSVAAQPEVPAGRVLAAAHSIGSAAALGTDIPHREPASLPLGEGPLWLVREETSSRPDGCTAVLPAWSARSEHDLSDAALGFTAVKNALASGPDPWDARQAAMARYSRTGFEAAAVTAVAVFAAMRQPRRRRVAELRFGHPYAVVAVTTEGNGVPHPSHPRTSAWHGLPVFSAWVSEPEDATADSGPDSTQ